MGFHWTLSIIVTLWHFSAALIPSPNAPFKNKLVKSLLLPFLHLSISMPSSLAVLFSFSLSLHLSSMTRHSRTASRTWSVSLWCSPLPCSLYSSHPYLPMPPFLPHYLLSGLRLFDYVRTETHPDFYLILLCKIYNMQCTENYISLSICLFPPIHVPASHTHTYVYIERKL